MAGWTKLFSSIVTSSVWCEDDHTLRVWIAMLAMSDAEGLVEGSIPGLASVCRMTPDQMRHAIDRLSSADPDSRTKAHEGRRIEAFAGGWKILNYLDYRDRGQAKEGSRAPYFRRYRAQQKDVARNTEERGERLEAVRPSPPKGSKDVTDTPPAPKGEPGFGSRGGRKKQPTDNGTQAAPAPWSREAADDFKAVYGGNPPAQFFPHVAAVVKKHAWETVRPVLRAVLEETPLEYLNLPKVLGVRVEAAAAGILTKPPRKGGKTIESPVDSYDAVYEAMKRGEL